MPAPVRLNAEDLDPVRTKILGAFVKVDGPSALGRLVALYSYCTEHQATILPAEVIDAIADARGFADAMVKAQLADRTDDGVLVRWTVARDGKNIGWLVRNHENGSRGGRPRRNPSVTPSDNPRVSETPPNGNPSVGPSPNPSDGPPVTPRVSSPDLRTPEDPEDPKVSEDLQKSEGSGSRPRTARREQAPPSDGATRAARYLRDSIRTHKPDLKCSDADVTRWARDFDLMVKHDARDWNRVKAVIDFCHRSPEGSFWKANILSAGKLREQFDRVEIQMQERRGAQAAGGSVFFDLAREKASGS